MLRVHNIKLSFGHDEASLIRAVSKKLNINAKNIESYKIIRRSLDIRKRPDIYYVYTIDVVTSLENAILKANRKNSDIRVSDASEFKFTIDGSEKLSHRPVIVGFGPAGIFCAMMLAENGYRPIVIERGEKVEDRINTVNKFWESGYLKPDSNAQFGEGGAGTFSDGKLNTLVKDNKGIITRVLEEFVRFGAKDEIRYEAKPHIGTDALIDIIRKMREHIINCGGEIRFNTKFTSFETTKDGHIVHLSDGSELLTDALVLALGHSARDTFKYLAQSGIDMAPKAFAVGFRVEHPQEMIDKATYHMDEKGELPVAAYKITSKTTSGRGVYSFCMCPGGYVVNASSEQGMLAVNGMSYSARDGENANSAIIITVNPDDFGSDDVLAGIEYQRQLERNAFELGNGKIPQQLYGDFKNNMVSESYGEYESATKGAAAFTNMRGLLGDEMDEAFIEGMEHFGNIIPGFNRDDAILSGIESRTSSPVRINRDKEFRSSIDWIYPCGEGAGFAGGITSAAMDGIKVAQAIAHRFHP